VPLISLGAAEAKGAIARAAMHRGVAKISRGLRVILLLRVDGLPNRKFYDCG
jgi:hypothetical protein